MKSTPIEYNNIGSSNSTSLNGSGTGPAPDCGTNGKQVASAVSQQTSDGNGNSSNRRYSISSMDEEDDKGRIAWGHKVEFVLSIVSYAVGLGNIWRFPYLVDRNGGGAFLIPYILMAIFEGLPLFYLEMLLGQSIRQGSIGVWVRIDRCLTGIGYAATVCSYILGIYYNVLIMWCLWYFFNSFRSELPWQKCPEFANDSLSVQLAEECAEKGPTAYYFYRETLDISEGIDVRGTMNWKMLVSLTAAWIIVYGCMCKGIKTSGKVVYFTALFPYMVMIIFFVRAMTLEGISVGLEYLFTPKVEKLYDPVVWLDAACQIFYSFGLAFGGLIAFASYNKRENNCKLDALGVSVCNVFTALFAAVIIFSVLGNKATMISKKCVVDNNQFMSQLTGYNLTTDETMSLFKLLDVTNSSGVNYVNGSIDIRNLSSHFWYLTDRDESFAPTNVYARYWDSIGRSAILLNNSLAAPLASNNFPRGVVHVLANGLNGSAIVSVSNCDPKNDLSRAGSGTGLAFIAFTQAIVEFPVAPLWSVLFFLMLLALGLGSEFGTLEGVAANIIDSVQDPKSWLKKRWFVSLLLCSSSYAIGILFTFSNGFYFIDVFDTFGASFPLLIIALLEASAAIFVCGYDRLNRFAKRCHGKDLEIFWKITWYMAPFLLASLFVATIVKKSISGIPYIAYRRWEDSVESVYPGWTFAIGSCLLIVAISAIPVFAVYYWMNPEKRFKGRRRHANNRAEAASSTLPLAFQSGVSICSEDSMMMSSDEMMNRMTRFHNNETETQIRSGANAKARTRHQSKPDDDLEPIESARHLSTVDGVRVDFLA